MKKYKVLDNNISVLKYYTCGDGCCGEWETDYDFDLEVSKGDIVEIQGEYILGFSYQVGSDYEGFWEEDYRLEYDIQYYIDEKYLEEVR